VTKKVMLGACWAWVGAISPRGSNIVEARMDKRGMVVIGSSSHWGRSFIGAGRAHVAPPYYRDATDVASRWVESQTGATGGAGVG
jgi:hypothetical protein